MLLGARVLRAADEQRRRRPASAITVDTIGVDLLPVLASTSSAIEFGTGRGFSIRLSSGSRIRK